MFYAKLNSVVRFLVENNYCLFHVLKLSRRSSICCIKMFYKILVTQPLRTPWISENSGWSFPNFKARRRFCTVDDLIKLFRVNSLKKNGFLMFEIFWIRDLRHEVWSMLTLLMTWRLICMQCLISLSA